MRVEAYHRKKTSRILIVEGITGDQNVSIPARTRTRTATAQIGPLERIDSRIDHDQDQSCDRSARCCIERQHGWSRKYEHLEVVLFVLQGARKWEGLVSTIR